MPGEWCDLTVVTESRGEKHPLVRVVAATGGATYRIVEGNQKGNFRIPLPKIVIIADQIIPAVAPSVTLRHNKEATNWNGGAPGTIETEKTPSE